jgi:hypothetical protein
MVFLNSSSGTTIAEAANVQHISIFGIREGAQHFSQHFYNVTVNSHNGQLMLHTDSHASDSGAVWREGRIILGAKSKVLYSEIALCRAPFGIGHVYISIFLLRMTNTVTSPNIGTFCICRFNYNVVLINVVCFGLLSSFHKKAKKAAIS